MWPFQIVVPGAQSTPPDLPAMMPDELWSTLLLGSWGHVITLVVFAALMVTALLRSRRGYSYLSRQERFLDHQEGASRRALEQNDAINRSIEEQYARVNEFNEAALRQSEEVLALQREILGELRSMTSSLQRLSASR